MITINDKISLIIDVDDLFELNDPEVDHMINGDSYKIDGLYKKSLNIFQDNYWYKFKHLMTGEIMSLKEWTDYYQCDVNDPKSIVVFLRLAEQTLI